jgi:hypothetical protein
MEFIELELPLQTNTTISISIHYPDSNISFVELHRIAKRATPSIMGEYKIALKLY